MKMILLSVLVLGFVAGCGVGRVPVDAGAERVRVVRDDVAPAAKSATSMPRVVGEQTFTNRGDFLYPLEDSPTATILVADVTQAPPDGPCRVERLWSYLLIGALTATSCPVRDGLCCTCNVDAKGRRPECGFVIRYAESETSGECTHKIWDGPVTPPNPPKGLRARKPSGPACIRPKQRNCWRTTRSSGILKRDGTVVPAARRPNVGG